MYLPRKVNLEFEAANEKLSSLEEKYIGNSISQPTYEKWYPLYSSEVNKKKIELSELQKDGSQQLRLYDKIAPYLNDLGLIYNKADVGHKISFLKGVFWGGFTKEKVGGRTALLNPLFQSNSLKIERLLRVDEMKKPDFSSGFPTCTLRVGLIELY